jgi:serine/threonine protein kinase/formylglycine-generating enzyme required for sulfatase activity
MKGSDRDESSFPEETLPACPHCSHPLTTDSISKGAAAVCPQCGKPLSAGLPENTTGDDALESEVASFGPYLQLEEITRGGMGVIYKATQPSLDRPVVIKMLSRHLSKKQEFVERFHREAKAMAVLDHPNIVNVLDRGVLEDTYYIVMEYVHGKSFKELIEEKAVKPDETLKVIEQVLEALAYAHEAGVIHRDVKPANIMVDESGKAKLTDFGIAYIIGFDKEQVRLTQTDTVLGTMNYIAPEQMEDTATVDARADLFSVGVVLYEALMGELPIGRFSYPSEKVLGLDPRIDDVLAGLLAKNVDDRYQTAEEVLEDLGKIIRRESGPMKRSVRPKKQSWISVLIVLLLMASATFVYYRWRRHREEEADKEIGSVLSRAEELFNKDQYYSAREILYGIRSKYPDDDRITADILKVEHNIKELEQRCATEYERLLKKSATLWKEREFEDALLVWESWPQDLNGTPWQKKVDREIAHIREAMRNLTPEEKRAKKALAAARLYESKSPDDMEGCLKKFQNVMRDYSDTVQASLAEAKAHAIERKIRNKLELAAQAHYDRLGSDFEALEKAKNYDGIFRLFDEFPPEYRQTKVWRQIQKKKVRICEKAVQRFSKDVEKVEALRRKGRIEDAQDMARSYRHCSRIKEIREHLLRLNPLLATLREMHRDMIRIPEGTFLRGSDRWSIGSPKAKVHLKAFSIDKFEVTNRDYALFLAFTGSPAPAHWADGKIPHGEDLLPVTHVRYEEAMTFALWAGKRLPTELEWEKATRGPDGLLYPFGNEFFEGKCACRRKKPLPVGSFPEGASPYGVLDLAGNVWEWTASWYLPYPGCKVRDKSFGNIFKVIRGGGFKNQNAREFRSFVRLPEKPLVRRPDLGFRCAKDAE